MIHLGQHGCSRKSEQMLKPYEYLTAEHIQIVERTGSLICHFKKLAQVCFDGAMQRCGCPTASLGEGVSVSQRAQMATSVFCLGR